MFRAGRAPPTYRINVTVSGHLSEHAAPSLAPGTRDAQLFRALRGPRIWRKFVIGAALRCPVYSTPRMVSPMPIFSSQFKCEKYPRATSSNNHSGHSSTTHTKTRVLLGNKTHDGTIQPSGNQNTNNMMRPCSTTGRNETVGKSQKRDQAPVPERDRTRKAQRSACKSERARIKRVERHEVRKQRRKNETRPPAHGADQKRHDSPRRAHKWQISAPREQHPIEPRGIGAYRQSRAYDQIRTHDGRKNSAAVNKQKGPISVKKARRKNLINEHDRKMKETRERPRRGCERIMGEKASATLDVSHAARSSREANTARRASLRVLEQAQDRLAWRALLDIEQAQASYVGRQPHTALYIMRRVTRTTPAPRQATDNTPSSRHTQRTQQAPDMARVGTTARHMSAVNDANEWRPRHQSTPGTREWDDTQTQGDKTE
ncbi:hypothetical protein C8J57DRAFT_1240053 [Mycena rebaudengoi]|nr:hypothetical protein C8J57DRAFT_1240053 [Mycena rebaudengoi]